MEKRTHISRLVAIFVLVAGFTAAGLVLAWRLYNQFSVKQASIETKSVLSALQEGAQNPYVYDFENRILYVDLSDEARDLLLTAACQNERVVKIELASFNQITIVALDSTGNKILLKANYTTGLQGVRLVLSLRNVKLGALEIPVLEFSSVKQEFESLSFDLDTVLPAWFTLQSFTIAAGQSRLQLNVSMAALRENLSQYVSHNDTLLNYIAVTEEKLSLFDDYFEDGLKTTVSAELAEKILSGLFTEGEERTALIQTIAQMDDASYQKLCALLDTHFKQLGLVQQIAETRFQYKMKACELVSTHYLQIFAEATQEKELHACVFYPLDVLEGKVYDLDWIEANMPKNLLLETYCEARLYYDEVSEQASILIQIPDEEKVFVSDGATTKVLSTEELSQYPACDEAPRAVTIAKKVNAALGDEIKCALCHSHLTEQIALRYLSFTENELFVVYSVDDSLVLRGRYFIKNNGEWDLVDEEVGTYKEFAKSHAGVNYALFPKVEYAGLLFSRLSNKEIEAIQDKLSSDNQMAHTDYFVYYSCLGNCFYYETKEGVKGTLNLGETSEAALFASVLESEQ